MKCWIPEIIDTVDLPVLNAALAIEEFAVGNGMTAAQVDYDAREGRIDRWVHLPEVMECSIHGWLQAVKLAAKQMAVKQ